MFFSGIELTSCLLKGVVARRGGGIGKRKIPLR